jgi:hypothetical protein
MARKRRGKIARFPQKIRDRVNVMMRDGLAYADIIERLGPRGAGLTERCLSVWWKGGHAEWLRENERLEDMRISREFALRIVKENAGKTIQETALQIATTHIYELLTEFDPAKLKRKFKGGLEDYTRIVQLLVRISDGGLKYERYRAEVAERKAKIQQEIERAREGGGITMETLEHIEGQIKLL